MADKEHLLGALSEVLAERRGADPDASYTARLLADGTAAILAKIEEESGEVIDAAATEDDAHLIHEIADLWFHTLVLLTHRRLSADDVLAELGRRFGMSGLAEKAARQRQG